MFSLKKNSLLYNSLLKSYKILYKNNFLNNSFFFKKPVKKAIFKSSGFFLNNSFLKFFLGNQFLEKPFFFNHSFWYWWLVHWWVLTKFKGWPWRWVGRVLASWAREFLASDELDCAWVRDGLSLQGGRVGECVGELSELGYEVSCGSQNGKSIRTHTRWTKSRIEFVCETGRVVNNSHVTGWGSLDWANSAHFIPLYWSLDIQVLADFK